MQCSINILLGTALSTICLTIPAVLAVGLITGKTVALGKNSGKISQRKAEWR
jgi:Ca2+:H+ antiporter